MKKILIGILAAALILALVGCGSKTAPNGVFEPQDIDGKRIGVMNSSASKKYAGRFGEALSFSSSDELLDALKYGSVDCVVIDAAKAESIITKKSGLKILSAPLISPEYCFAVAKENADLTRDINAAVKKLSDSGVLSGICDRYIKGSGSEYIPPEVTDPKGSLTAAVTTDFPPYSYLDADGTLAGIDIDIARAVCAELGISLEFKEVDAASLITTVQYGKASFALGGIYMSESDLDMVDFSTPYAKPVQVIVVRK